MVCRRCPGCTTPNPHFTGEPAVLLEGIEIEPEVYRALQVICGTDSKTLPEVAVNAIEFYITTRTRRKT